MSKIKIHEDQKYIKGVASNNSFIIQAIYDKFAPKVINYIKNNGGDSTNAKEIINEVLNIIYNQANTTELELTCPFDGYFFLLCKRKWSSKRSSRVAGQFIFKNKQVKRLVLRTSLFEEKQALFNTAFNQLSSNCKELLKVYFRSGSLTEVSSILGIPYPYAKKKKSQCLGRITELIKISPSYNSLKKHL
ncbi:sigma-70 RNA polymerase sigma factor region 4 domain-containing protein [Tenacibaculum maritimum]|uniref:sigma-70 family RNA polymerase sigma factor n=1 Tax=Tenacibaculum maritimum TaxID=107401 RepID=UPI0038765ACC